MILKKYEKKIPIDNGGDFFTERTAGRLLVPGGSNTGREERHLSICLMNCPSDLTIVPAGKYLRGPGTDISGSLFL